MSNDIKRRSIAELRRSGGKEHNVNYVSEVDYSALAKHVEGTEGSMNRAYAQRNTMAVALVKMALLLGWPAGRGIDGRQDHPVEWRQVVYVQLPGGEQDLFVFLRWSASANKTLIYFTSHIFVKKINYTSKK